jgi:hypothetical protein
MRALAVLVCLIALPLYLGSYAALVKPSLYDSVRFVGQVQEHYPRLDAGSPRAAGVYRGVFAPVNWLDCKLRPGTWERPACVW